MRICHVLLSSTWGMHQYTADLANRMSEEGCEVHCVTSRFVPRDRYAPGITLHTPVASRTTGFSAEGLYGLLRVTAIGQAIRALQPDVVHFTGPHLWNLALLRQLGEYTPTIHTLHDLHPHMGAAYGRLLYAWNVRVQREASHLLVHGQCFRTELVGRGVDPSRVTWTPLTHLFVGYETERALMVEAAGQKSEAGPHSPEAHYEPWALFMGRLERYKGVSILAEAAHRLERHGIRIVIAGKSRSSASPRAALLRGGRRVFPDNLELLSRRLGDDEALDLFRRCSVVVLPYLEASQSALVAASFFFRKPVIITRKGALPEYVDNGITGWVIPANDVSALAEALRDALSNPKRLAAMGNAGRGQYERWRQQDRTLLREMYARVATRAQDAHA